MCASLQLLLESLHLRFWTMHHYEIENAQNPIVSATLSYSVLWYIEYGNMAITVDETSYGARSGQFFLFPSGSVLSAIVEGKQAGVISIHFDADIPLLKNQSWNNVLRIPVDIGEGMEKTTALLSEMIACAGQSSPLASMLQRGLFLQLMALLMTFSLEKQEMKEAMPAIDPRIEAIVEHLAKYPETVPNINNLCQFMYFSPSYLRKLFVQATGLPPLQFIHQYKMEQAKKVSLKQLYQFMSWHSSMATMTRIIFAACLKSGQA